LELCRVAGVRHLGSGPRLDGGPGGHATAGKAQSAQTDTGGYSPEPLQA
jgi:hypothetical protein